MGNLLTNYSPEDQQKIKDWTKQQGGAADIDMAISALGVKPIATPTTVTPANNPVANTAPASGNNPLVTQKGTNQYVTAFTGREQEGFDSWYDMLKNGGSALPDSMVDSIRGTYEKEGDRAFNNTIGGLSSLTGGRVGAAAAAAASQARNNYSQMAGKDIANTGLGYAQMILNGMGNYVNAVGGRDDVAFGRDSTERQQGFNNNIAIGEATGYLPTSTMNVNNPWIKDGKAVDGVDFQSIYNAKKAINPNDPDLPLIMQARNLKIQSDPELMKKYGGTMTGNVGYETLAGKKATAEKEYNAALLEWQKDPKNSENIARLKNAQANLTSAGASASNAATNKAELDWAKDPNNPDNILKLAQAGGKTPSDKYNAVVQDLSTLSPDKAYEELTTYGQDYIKDLGLEPYNKLLAAYKKAAGVE